MVLQVGQSLGKTAFSLKTLVLGASGLPDFHIFLSFFVLDGLPGEGPTEHKRTSPGYKGQQPLSQLLGGLEASF